MRPCKEYAENPELLDPRADLAGVPLQLRRFYYFLHDAFYYRKASEDAEFQAALSGLE